MSFLLDTSPDKRKYKGHHIHAGADQNPKSQNWTPRAFVSWEENGETCYKTLYGSHNQAQSLLNAIKCAFQIAMDWIDNGKPE
jgi:hypothetical protein